MKARAIALILFCFLTVLGFFTLIYLWRENPHEERIVHHITGIVTAFSAAISGMILWRWGYGTPHSSPSTRTTYRVRGIITYREERDIEDTHIALLESFRESVSFQFKDNSKRDIVLHPKHDPSLYRVPRKMSVGSFVTFSAEKDGALQVKELNLDPNINLQVDGENIFVFVQ